MGGGIFGRLPKEGGKEEVAIPLERDVMRSATSRTRSFQPFFLLLFSVITTHTRIYCIPPTLAGLLKISSPSLSLLRKNYKYTVAGPAF